MTLTHKDLEKLLRGKEMVMEVEIVYQEENSEPEGIELNTYIVVIKTPFHTVQISNDGTVQVYDYKVA